MMDSREPVFIAANVAEAEFVENLLETEGIDFDLTPEPFLHDNLSNACYTGLLFEVLPGQAPYCRHLLRARGLGRGVVG